MILIEDAQGLSVWPEELIASLTPAYPNRLRVVCADGTVGYMPLPVPPGPWQLHGEAWVQPGHVSEGLDPALFPHPGVEPAPPPEYHQEPYWGLFRTPDGLLWDGTTACEVSLEQASQALLQAGRDLWIQPRRLRRLEKNGPGLLLEMDEGTVLKVGRVWTQAILDHLGVTSFQLMPPGLTRIFLRDYPFEIARAPAALLRQHFRDLSTMIANSIWQQFCYHQLGLHKSYGTSPRGFWYNPLNASLPRIFDINPHEVEILYYQILARMADDYRLFGYRDLGFEDPGAFSREIGAKYPGIILVIEKSEVREAGVSAARHFGLSWHITGGISRIFTAEFCAYAVREAHQGPARALIFGDFDPGGRVNGRAVVDHLGRFGLECPAGPEFLIEAASFTEEELELFSHPLSKDDDRVEAWIAETGGIHGQPRGIHADWIQPPERLIPLIAARLKEIDVQNPGGADPHRG